jgi:hypothetical protein
MEKVTYVVSVRFCKTAVARKGSLMLDKHNDYYIRVSTKCYLISIKLLKTSSVVYCSLKTRLPFGTP